MNRRRKERPMKRKKERQGNRPLSADELLRFMAEEERPLLWREILRRLGLAREEGIGLRRLLRQLTEEGKLVRIRGNRYGLPTKMNLVVGKLRCHPDGFAFVIPEKEGEDHIFISPRKLGGALHGDRVVARVESMRRKGKEGRVIRVLERSFKKVVGRFARGKHYAYLVPEDERILQEIFIPEGETKRAKAGQIVVAEIVRYPEATERPEGRITHILGYPDDPEIEPQIIIHKYDLPHRFSSAALAQARTLPSIPSPEQYHDRVDLRQIPTFTIDGEKARDFDDAVAIEEDEKGERLLYVSISDVSHYVEEGSPLDQEAFFRGTSVYFPDRAIPMFPPELSNELCCLQPGVDRLTLTVEMRFDEEGEPKGVRFYPSVIRSAKRLTYTAVRKALVDGDEATQRELRPLMPSLEAMARLAEALRARRLARGALDFDLPEPEVILNLQGEAEDVVRAERNLAHQIIEEFMIAANEAVARFLEEAGIPSIYRIHEPPSEESMKEFRRFLSCLGYRMRKTETPSPKGLQKVLEAVRGKKEEKVVNKLLLRSMKWAKYAAENIGHFGLASQAYTHFTSPIRRYPDLMVHRLVKRVLSKRGGRLSPEELAQKADHLSNRERVAMEAEREILDRYRVRLMKDRIREVYDGVISGVTAFGFFVELDDIYVEGLVPMTSLHDDYYRYDEKRYVLIGERTGKTFRIGDPVRVRVERVDVERRRIDFGLITG